LILLKLKTGYHQITTLKIPRCQGLAFNEQADNEKKIQPTVSHADCKIKENTG